MNKAFSVLFIIAYRSCTRAGYPVFLHRPFAFRTQNFFARLGTFFISCLPFFAVPVSPCFCTGRLSSAIFCMQNFLPIWNHFSFLACHFLLSRYPRVFQSAVCLQLSSACKIFCPFGTIFRFLPAIFLLSGCRFFVCQILVFIRGRFLFLYLPICFFAPAVCLQIFSSAVTGQLSYNSIGRPSGSWKKVNFLSVSGSMRMSST